MLDVGGEKFSIDRKLVQRYPSSRLARLLRAQTLTEILKHCDEYTLGSPPEYYYDRNPDRFPVILNLYRIEELHMMRSGCPVVFQRELEYWMIDEDDMEPCCAIKYYEEVHVCQKGKEEDSEINEKAIELAEDENFGQTKLGKIRYFIWRTLEYPGSSPYAQIWAVVSMLLVVLSTALFFYETLDVEENPENSDENPNKAAVLETIDNVVMFFFTIEYVLRLITSPNTQ